VSDYEAVYEELFVRNLRRYASIRTAIKRRVERVLADPYMNTEGPYRGRIKQLNLNSPVFAEKGHREATLVEICERANANIAAAKYYFRDKATLGKV